MPIHLIVRGICCLRSGLKDLTDTIEVISIVGRYLEHSRIYSFGVGEQQKLYISSGDWMTRSTKSRVEIAAPIYDPQIKEEINHALDIMLHDNMNARVDVYKRQTLLWPIYSSSTLGRRFVSSRFSFSLENPDTIRLSSISSCIYLPLFLYCRLNRLSAIRVRSSALSARSLTAETADTASLFS